MEENGLIKINIDYDNNEEYKTAMKISLIIIFYFDNVAFFHAKLGSDICPRVNNQTSGDTLQHLTRPLLEILPVIHPQVLERDILVAG